MRYLLGTASFGLNYGISNEFKQVKKNSALEIIKLALNSGFYGVDSAQNYGNAHSIINEALRIHGHFHVTSKLGKSAFSSKETFISEINSIINDLGIRKLDVLLIHDFEILLNHDKGYLRRLLHEVQQMNLVSRIGISVYSEEEVHHSKIIVPELEVFQIPESICDRRFGNSRKLRKLADSGNSFYARSIFLQGMLLAKLEKFPKHMTPFAEQIRDFQNYWSDLGVDPLNASISYVQSLDWLEGIVVGANSVEQINQIVDAIQNPCDFDFANTPRVCAEWLDPRKWIF
jgi:aryl-alcohol dehydrogenase-like predicted oxidoreductase